MKILVLGGDGMLGHQLLEGLGVAHEVRGTSRRKDADHHQGNPTRDTDALYLGVDVRNAERMREVIDDFRPAAIVNAVGIVKQRAAAKQSLPSIEVNSLFPHRLSDMAEAFNARVVQVSTDCVFSGTRGMYVETDSPDPVDLYGYTKLLGEVAGEHCVTLRTSIIGLELQGRQGLVEWALSQSGEIRGYRQALYSGLTTRELTRVIELVLSGHGDLHGVWHVASEPITKYDLLVRLLAKVGRSDVTVLPDDDFVCDRTLRADAFAGKTGYSPPSWDPMLEELAGLVLEREGGTR